MREALRQSDLKLLITRNATWRGLAAADIRSKYQRTSLGPWWITLSNALFALGIGLVSGRFLGSDMSAYLPYFMISMTVWNFISSCLNEATLTLIYAGGNIKASNFPIIFYVMRMVHRNFIIFVHNFAVVPLLWLVFRWTLTWNAIFFVFGIACVYAFVAGASLIIAIACTRYRDLPPLVSASVQFLFFISPIIWLADQIRGGHLVILLNPISHLLAVSRDPILSHPIGGLSWLLAPLTAALVNLAAVLVYVKYRRKIVYWV